jgi:hypothetical protein
MTKKQPYWINYGDVNHREEGGQFVHIDLENGTVEVVQVQNWYKMGHMKRQDKDEHGHFLSPNCIYRLESAEYGFDEIARHRREQTGPYSFADWQRLDGQPLIEIVGMLATDMVAFFGGDCEGDVGSNYWELLSRHGITRNNFH